AHNFEIQPESGRDSGQPLIAALDMTRKDDITGLGATSPIGGDVDTMWANVLAGTSGARPIEKDWVQEYNLPVTFAAQLTNDASEVLSRVEARRMDPTTQMGLVAAREAWANAGLADEQVELDPERLAVAFGTGIGGVWTLLDSWDNLRERGPRRVLPM